jgi:hypothetical protein
VVERHEAVVLQVARFRTCILAVLLACGICISKARRHLPSTASFDRTSHQPLLLSREDTMSSHGDNLAPAFAPFFGMVSACDGR